MRNVELAMGNALIPNLTPLPFRLQEFGSLKAELHALWSIATAFLLRRGWQLPFLVAGVIAAPRARDQFAAALRIDAHLDRAERAIAVFVGWVIADYVLRAQVFG